MGTRECTRDRSGQRGAAIGRNDAVGWFAAAAAMLVAGCGPRITLDEPLARQSLHAALDCWRDGRPAESLRSETPSIVAVDDDWQRGARLTGYRLLDQGRSDGMNLHVRVELSLWDESAKRASQSVVTYLVGTSPTITIFRHDE